MSSSHCCFLTCILVSQETGKMVWYSHPLQNFPLFFFFFVCVCVSHTVKGFSIVSEAKVYVLLDFSSFFCDPMDAGNLTHEVMGLDAMIVVF